MSPLSGAGWGPAARVVPGVWGVLATPFRDGGAAVDEESLARQARRYGTIGASGVTALGVFGEAARLDPAERRAVVATVAGAGSGLPMVVGVSSLGTAETIAEIENVVEPAGAALAAVMVQVNAPDPEAVATHLRRVYEATGVGVVVQDYPAASGVRIAAADLVAAVRALPFVVGVKSESSPSPPAVAVLAAGLDVPVFGGLGGTCLLDELAVGAAGAMTGFSVPEGLVEAVAAYRAGGFEAARAAWLPYLPLVNFEFQPGIALGIRKESLRRRGLLVDPAVRPPGVPIPDELRGLLGRHLAATPHCARAAE